MEPFADWWARIVKSDLLACVFCGQPIKDLQTAVLGWWERDNITVVAAGLYHHGSNSNGPCLRAAVNLGPFLRDTLAQDVDSIEMRRIVRTYRDWEPEALRRLVLIAGELSDMNDSHSSRR